MLKKEFLRINGRGNAWPIPLGQENPFYHLAPEPDYANASYSLLTVDVDETILSDILIDAGHGVIPFLLKHGNRIPDAMVITHPHFDHILGMDWIIQSYYRFHYKQKYSVYATKECWLQIIKILPHLEELVAFHELYYGIPEEVEQAEDLSVTAFPVYHGSHAPGAAMLLFEKTGSGQQILFTGDVLLPLLRKSDLEQLRGLPWLVADANNRFPYPGSNHWSVSHHPPEEKAYISEWVDHLLPGILWEPHIGEAGKNRIYMESFQNEFPDKNTWLFTLMDLLQKIRAQNVILSHYSGLEDRKYYGEKILDTVELHRWGQKELARQGLTTKVWVPETGEKIFI